MSRKRKIDQDEDKKVPMCNYTVKKGLRTILVDPSMRNKIIDVVKRASQIALEQSKLLLFHVIYCMENGMPLPDINQTFLQKVSGLVSTTTSKGPKPKIDQDLKNTHAIYMSMRDQKTPLASRECIKDIVNQMCSDFLVNIKNHINLNFEKRHKKYVFMILFREIEDRKIPCVRKIGKEYKLLKSWSYKNKQRLVHEVVARTLWSEDKHATLTPCFHFSQEFQIHLDELIKEHKKGIGIIPIYDENWQSYLPWLHKILKETTEEQKKHNLTNKDKKKKGVKTFTLLPCRKVGLYHIPITNTTLYELVNVCCEKDHKEFNQYKKHVADMRKMKLGVKKNENDVVEQKRDEKKQKGKLIKESLVALWNSIFTFETVNGYKKRVFDYHIKTDGVSASIMFKREGEPRVSDRQKKKQKLEPKKKEKKSTKSQEVKKEEKEEKHVKKQLRTFELEHVSMYNDAEIVIGLDPGRRDLFTCVESTDFEEDKTDVHMSTIEYRHLAGMNKRRAYINNLIKKNKQVQQYVDRSETQKVHTVADYKKYLEHELTNLQTNMDFYYQKKITKQGFKAYIRKYQALDQACQRITHGTKKRDVLVGYGDGSFSSCSKGHAPGPVKALRTRLCHHAIVIDVDEHLTSQICSHPACGHKLKSKKGREEGWKIKGVQVCSNLYVHENALTYWNRDTNAARNIVHVLEHAVLNGGDWPREFHRKTI